MSRFLDRRGALSILSGMRINARQLLVVALVWAVLFVPFAHSSALSAHSATPASSGHHHGAAIEHEHGAAPGHCHQEAEHEEQAPTSSDPCTMCQSHPICHMVVLPEPLFVLPPPDAQTFEFAHFPSASILSFKPPLTPPRT